MMFMNYQFKIGTIRVKTFKLRSTMVISHYISIMISEINLYVYTNCEGVSHILSHSKQC